jgi:predicted nucleic acid-binding protein
MGPQVTSATPRVYLDSNVFIAAFERAGAHSDHAWWIMRAIEQGEIIGATSELTLAELLVKPLELGDAAMASGYEKMIEPGPGFEVSPVRRDILVTAAGIRAGRASVRLPDAIHVATAQALQCSFFVTDDRRLKVPDDITRLDVGPFTLDDIFKEQA